MARHRFLLRFVASVALIPWLAKAQETPPPPPPVPAAPAPAGPPQRFLKPQERRDFREPFFREMRERFEKMPEEQRRKIIDKFRKWQQMPGDEQAHFRFMLGEREKRAQQAVDDTIQAGGLKLDEAQKQKFTEIYKQERRKLEEQLRDEMNQRRQDRLPAMQKAVIDAYQKEAAATAPSPAPSTTP